VQRKPIAIDIFAGVGGLSEGLHLAGWDVAVAIEKNSFAADSYDFNQNKRQKHNTNVLRTDIANVGYEELSQALKETRGLSLDEVDLVAGGPPCQGFSYIGPRSLDDPRNRLFFDFIRIVHLVRPKVFIAENVRGILSFARGRMPKLLNQIFDKLGYNLSYDIINSLEFGVPQDRARVIFFGIRRDIAKSIGINVLRSPAPYMPDFLREYYPAGHIITLREALSDLPLGQATALEDRIWITDGEIHPKERQDEPYPYPEGRQITHYQAAMRRQNSGIYNNHTKGMSEGRLNKVRLIPEGGVMSTAARVNAWRRLSWERHSHTVQAHMGKDLREFIHPSVNRWITVREAARLQSFDDAYVFLGSQNAQLSQIGNAVPPFVGWAVGLSIGEQVRLINYSGFPLREPNLCQGVFPLREPRDARWFGLVKYWSLRDIKKMSVYMRVLYNMMVEMAQEEKALHQKTVKNKVAAEANDIISKQPLQRIAAEQYTPG
jgi:DNA (cytosine-5)-methyltransferase 1